MSAHSATSPRPRGRHSAAAAVTLALVLALTAGACGSSGSEEPAGTLATTTTAAPLAAPEVSAGGTISVTKPPAPGIYEFGQTGTTGVLNQGQEPKTRDSTGTLEVSAPSQSAGGTEVQFERIEGGGTRSEQTLLYNDQGISLTSVRNTLPVVSQSRDYVCKPSRPVLILPVNIGPGSTWEDRVSCEAGQISYKATVGALTDVVLGDGTSVQALEIDVANTVDGPGLKTQSTQKYWFAPSLSLNVKVTDSTRAQLSVYDVTHEGTDLLQSATPKR